MDAQNPFEITSRLSAESVLPIEKTENVVDSSSVTSIHTVGVAQPTAVLTTPNDNPFELLAREEYLPETAIVEKESNPEAETKTVIPEITTRSISDWLSEAQTEITSSTAFILLLLILIPVTILFTIFRNYFGKAYNTVRGESILNRSYRDYAGASVIQMNSWFALYLLNIGLFVALALHHYGIVLGAPIWVHLMVSIGAMSTFILFKRLVIFLLGRLFGFEKEAHLYIYLSLVFGILSGVFLAFFNIAILYAPDILDNAVIFSGLAVFIILLFVRTYRALLVVNRLIVLHTFHFLLYICAVEIAPIFILIKLVLLYDQ